MARDPSARTAHDKLLETKLSKALDDLAFEQVNAPAHLTASVLKQITATSPNTEPVDRLIAWFNETFWRGAVAAALPVIIGLAVGSMNMVEQDDWHEAEMWVFADVLEEYDNNEI